MTLLVNKDPENQKKSKLFFKMGKYFFVWEKRGIFQPLSR